MPRLFVIIALLAAALLAAGCTRSHPAASTYSRCRIASVFRDSSMVWLMNDPQLGGPIETYVKKVPLGAEASSESQITIIVQSGGSSSREVLAMEQKQLFSTLLSSYAAFRAEYSKHAPRTLVGITVDYSSELCAARSTPEGTWCDRWDENASAISARFECVPSLPSDDPLDDVFWFNKGHAPPAGSEF